MSQGALGAVLEDGVAVAAAAADASGADNAAPELPALRTRSVTFSAAGMASPNAEAAGVAPLPANAAGKR